MKMRIKGDSLRLRVSRSELDRFFCGERIEETIHFAAGPDAKLTYALQRAPEGAETALEYKQGDVTVSISKTQSDAWREPHEVGIYASIDVGRGRTLELIAEKDFACLDRSDEDNTDRFPNPQGNANCQ
jgi:hypothetical protein